MSKVPEGVAPDRLNVIARQVLLDGLTALRPHLDAITVIGAQAVYLRTPDASIAGAAYTSDGDLSIDPMLLGGEPLINKALHNAGFRLRDNNQPGLWVLSHVINEKSVDIELDILVGDSLVPGGRAARIPPHDKMAAKKVSGIEVSIVDRSPLLIHSLDATDSRTVLVNVAGPVALLVAKSFKINDRLQAAGKRPDRLTNKDAGDVLRIMMVTPVGQVATSFDHLLTNSRVGSVVARGLRLLRDLFGGVETSGTRMAVEALVGDIPAARVRTLATSFISRLPEVN